MCDFVWLCVTLHDSACFCATLHHFAWLGMTPHDFAWLSVTLRNSAWLYLTQPESAWLHIIFVTPVTRYPVIPHDSAWLCMIPRDSIWLYLTLCDFGWLSILELFLTEIHVGPHWTVGSCRRLPALSFYKPSCILISNKKSWRDKLDIRVMSSQPPYCWPPKHNFGF
jgi:hypothetical protein